MGDAMRLPKPSPANGLLDSAGRELSDTTHPGYRRTPGGSFFADGPWHDVAFAASFDGDRITLRVPFRRSWTLNRGDALHLLDEAPQA